MKTKYSNNLFISSMFVVFSLMLIVSTSGRNVSRDERKPTEMNRSKGDALVYTPTPSPDDRFLSRYASAYGLRSLRNELFDANDIEVRIWTGKSNAYPKGLILSVKGNDRRAIFLSGKFHEGSPIRRDISITSDSRRFDAFFSQANELIGRADSDSQREWIDPDSENITIESKTAEVYVNRRWVVRDESKKVSKFIRFLETEFEIKLSK